MDVLENGGVLQWVKTGMKKRNKLNWNKFIWLRGEEKKNFLGFTSCKIEESGEK